MSINNREVEIKMVAVGCASRAELDRRLKAALDDEINNAIEGYSRDTFWTPPEGAKADFIRVRYRPDGKGQVTVKYQDKGHNQDRVEIDLDCEQPSQAAEIFKQLLGRPDGDIRKRYTVLFLEDEYTNVSTYRVVGDSRVFLEVEAKDSPRVDEIIEKIRGPVGFPLEVQTDSLYKIFLGRK